MTDNKICNQCKIEKDISEFYIRNGKPRATCKPCCRTARDLFRQTHREQDKATARKYRTTPKRRFDTAKTNASKRGLTWSISYDDYLNLISLSCYYCNFEFGKPNTTGSGLDRLDNSKDYELFNVVPCCGPCNFVRNNLFEPDEMKIAIQAVLNYRRSKVITGGVQ
jgi:hypothetical protein